MFWTGVGYLWGFLKNHFGTSRIKAPLSIVNFRIRSRLQKATSDPYCNKVHSQYKAIEKTIVYLFISVNNIVINFDLSVDKTVNFEFYVDTVNLLALKKIDIVCLSCLHH